MCSANLYFCCFMWLVFLFKFFSLQQLTVAELAVTHQLPLQRQHEVFKCSE